LAAVARIAGVYPVDAPEPCHLCELVVEGAEAEIDFGTFTQPFPGRDPDHWQVAYDEQCLASDASRSVYVFFFHYLDLNQPMQSSFGPLALPTPTPRPKRLDFVEYEAP
jgi:hypothetical protein